MEQEVSLPGFESSLSQSLSAISGPMMHLRHTRIVASPRSARRPIRRSARAPEGVLRGSGGGPEGIRDRLTNSTVRRRRQGFVRGGSAPQVEGRGGVRKESGRDSEGLDRAQYF
eukprot:1193937-Prorocentrum_minimum.AAC.2